MRLMEQWKAQRLDEGVFHVLLGNVLVIQPGAYAHAQYDLQ